MEEIKIIDNKKYKKMNIESIKVDGSEMNNMISVDDMKGKDKLVVDIVIKTQPS